MCDVVGGISIVFSIVYFFACSGWEGFKSSFNRRENRGRQMSEIEALTESAYGIRHSSQLKFPIITQKSARAMNQLSYIKRA